MYKVTSSGIQRLSDGAYIPDDACNQDWRDYLAWLAAGNAAEPADPPSKADRIAHVLATLGKGKDRTLIQQVISFAEIVAAPMLATQYSVTLELAIMGLYARNKTYRECKDAETAIEAIEDEP